MLNDDPPLPVETILFASSAVRIGMFRCTADDLRFSDSGPKFVIPLPAAVP